MALAQAGALRVEQVMGMPVVVDVRDPEVDDASLEALYAWLRHVDETFSTYRAESEIGRLNRGELDEEDTSPEVREVLARCEELRVATCGFFDARAASPERVDPSGLVKGWAVDRAAAILDRAGLLNYAVDAGGDLRVRGAALPEERWRIGIQHPLLPDRLAAVVAANDLAIATSGTYNRGDHVIDPHTRRPPEGVLSVTVVGPELAVADAYATAAFAMGRDGARWLATLRDHESLVILADGTTLSTPRFPRAR